MLIAAIARYLHNNGLATFQETGAGGNVFLGYVPSTPDEIVALFDTPAPASDGALPYDNANFQVRVRGTKDIRTAHTKATAIYNALHGLHHFTLPDGTWLLRCIGSRPYPLGVDANGRHEYVSTFQTEILNTNNPNREDLS